MKIIDKNIDGGKSFDWGRTSDDYARFRDIYPQEFYERIVNRGLCIKGQNVLDIGTGTGVIPRKMPGNGMDIDYQVMPAEKINFPDSSFDVITACQCFWYFDHTVLMPKLFRMLKPNGSILVLYMAWLPFKDKMQMKVRNLC